MTRACSNADINLENCDSNSSTISSLLKPMDANCNDSCSWSIAAQAISSENGYIYQPSDVSDVQKSSLTEVLKNLLLIMDDITESYPEVNEVSDILEEIEQTLKVSFFLVKYFLFLFYFSIFLHHISVLFY